MQCVIGFYFQCSSCQPPLHEDMLSSVFLQASNSEPGVEVNDLDDLDGYARVSVESSKWGTFTITWPKGFYQCLEGNIADKIKLSQYITGSLKSHECYRVVLEMTQNNFGGRLSFRTYDPDGFMIEEDAWPCLISSYNLKMIGE